MAEIEEKGAEPEESQVPALSIAEPSALGPDAPHSMPTHENPKSRGGFGGPLLGGILAAALGFALAQFVPQGWPMASTSELQGVVEDQSAQIAALDARLGQLGDLESRLVALETAPVSTPTDQIDALSARIAALESAPAADMDSFAALQADIAALQAGGGVSSDAAAMAVEAETRLKEAEAAAARIQSEAEAMAEAAARDAAFGRLENALSSGAPFAADLPLLGPDIPADLVALATSGAPTLGALQEKFPVAARAALEASLHEDMGASWSERVGSFLRSQTGARALTPQEGSDPDAVLSRAEAALAGGDLAAALQELAALPASGQAAMAEWQALAKSRIAVEAAVATFAAKIGG